MAMPRLRFSEPIVLLVALGFPHRCDVAPSPVVQTLLVVKFTGYRFLRLASLNASVSTLNEQGDLLPEPNRPTTI